MAGTDRGWEQRRRDEALAAAQRRVAEALTGTGRPITGTARSDDGSVTVTVGLGGGLRSVRLSPEALGLGAEQLSRTVLAVAQRATARANQRAEHALTRVLGRRADRPLGTLGLGYDPAQADEPDYERDPLGRSR